MSTSAYREVLNQAQLLTTEEQLQLLEELAAYIRRQVVMRSKKHSIMEFEGLGKEAWEGIDVEKYIDEERNSWER